MDTLRVDIISDTHGHLSDILMNELEGADVIIHAGDIISRSNLVALKEIAPVYAVLGNNDFPDNLGPEVKREASFTLDGVSFYVKHIKPSFGHTPKADVTIFGHEHRSKLVSEKGLYEINPGSPTWPRGAEGSTMARLWITDGRVKDAEIIQLEP